MPDNRRVVISMSVTPGAPVQLWMGDTASGDRTVLLGGTTNHVGPSVSPDGNRLVFTEALSDYDVISMTLSDAAATRLIATRRYESMPAWAAREQALVYVTNRNGELEIWLRKPAAGGGTVPWSRLTTSRRVLRSGSLRHRFHRRAIE